MTRRAESIQPGNNLLGLLRNDELALLQPALESWHGKPGDVLYEVGDDVRTVYFPCGPSLVSYVVQVDDGKQVETLLIGREGAVGGIVSRGHLPAYARCVVQFPGEFLKIDVEKLDAQKERSRAIADIFARYADCLMAQVFQAVACNAAHTIEQRTAKWLVSAIDRTGEHKVPLTQEQLAGMLGVGRTYISRVIASLKTDNLLATRRGSLEVRNLSAIEALSCSCHAKVKEHFDDVLRGVYPSEPEPRTPNLNGGATGPAD
jgi:CRP-like cAMP-binding protein